MRFASILSVAAFGLTAVAANAQVEKSSPPPAQTITQKDIDAVSFSIEHLNLAPSPGSAASQWGVGAAGFFPFNPSWGLNLDGGFYTITSPGSTTTNGTRLQVSLVTPWSRSLGGIITPSGRAGLNVGYQSNANSGFSMQTWNYGGFIDAFPTYNLTLSARGGIVSKCAASNGYYLGAGAALYPTQDFSIRGTYDYSRFNAFGGSNESDYGLRLDYRLPSTQLGLYGGYTRSNFSPATNFHLDTTTLGLRLYGGGNKNAPLVDQQRNGTLDSSNLYLGLQCRF
jgi:opacity protein-like surface antigen